MKPSFAALLLVSAIAAGCSEDPPTGPTARPLYTQTISEVTLQARASGCVTFRPEAAGPGSASFGGNGPIEVGTGTCTSPGAVVGRTTRGDLSLLLAVGDHYVRFENPLPATITYRVTLHYLILV
jgi:hypothetical protein